MRTRCIGAFVAAAFLIVARATQTIMVDDGDPGVEYRGAWVHNPIDDPKDFNYGGSVTFTNATGSTATYRFAGTAIAVFGAFEVPGTFAMHSSYSIDGGQAVEFLPASTIARASYRQKFFQSDTLSDGEHTLIITNGGKEFWLDYLLVTQESQSTTAAATTSAPQKPQTLPSSTAQASPHTVVPATPSPGPTSAGRPETLQPSSGPSSQTQTTQSFTSTNNATLTSTDAAASSPFSTSSTPQSQTSTFALGIPSTSPSSAPEHAHSAKMAAGAIAGLAVAGLLVVVLIGLVGWRSRRRRRQTKHGDLAPYDPGLTALAFEPSDSEKHEGAREEGTGSRGSAVSSLLSLPLPRTAQAHTQAPDLEEARAFWSSADRGVPHEIRTTDLSGTIAGDNRLTGFEPLGSPSSASSLLGRRPRRTLRNKGSPITPSWGQSGSVSSALDERRRSVDGGVRIAGGPPVGNLRREDGDADDVRSGLSTLPPSYQLYPVA